MHGGHLTENIFGLLIEGADQATLILETGVILKFTAENRHF